MQEQLSKDTRITQLNFSPTILESFVDVVENQEELQEQLQADLLFGGINVEIKSQATNELIERLNELIPNIIIATHE